MSINKTELSLIEDKRRFKNILDVIPALPGCYLMKDNHERLLYIGKSKNLKTRVGSYFRNKTDLSPRISLMVQQIFHIEYIVTDTENEALTLQSNLINNHTMPEFFRSGLRSIKLLLDLIKSS